MLRHGATARRPGDNRFPVARSLSDLAPANSLCKTARIKTEEKGSEDFISDLLACLLEANRVVIMAFIRNPRAVLLLAACPKPESDRLLGN